MKQEEEDVMSESSEDIDDEFKDDYDHLKDGNVNSLPEIASINQIEDVCTIIILSLFPLSHHTDLCLCVCVCVCVQKIANLLQFGAQLLEDMVKGSNPDDGDRETNDSGMTTGGMEISKNFVETVKEISKEMAVHIHNVSLNPTLPFESNTYNSYQNLNSIVNRSKCIKDQL